jgi:small subunit ribosomal protein S3Ae
VIKMAEKGAKGRRKTVDKWKKKKWYTITASKIFNKKPLGETPVEKPVNLIGRTMNVTLDVLTGQRARRDVTVSFKTIDVQGQTITTKVSKFVVNKGALSRTIRRRNSKVSLVEKIPVKGGEARVNIVVVTANKATQNQKTGIRAIISEQSKILNGKDFEDVVKELLLGGFGNDLFKKSAKVYPVKKVIIAKATYTESK